MVPARRWSLHRLEGYPWFPPPSGAALTHYCPHPTVAQ